MLYTQSTMSVSASSETNSMEIVGASQRDFTILVSRANPSASQADVQGVWSTLSTLLTKVPADRGPRFLPGSQTLIPHDSNHRPSPLARTFLADLTQSAHEAATSLLCTSILGGRGSESDEFSDFSVFFGELSGTDDRSRIDEMLHVLGLDGWLKVSQVHVFKTSASPGALPASLQALARHRRFPDSDSKVERLNGFLQQLKDCVEARLVTFGEGGLNIHLFVGHKDGEGWIGLGGASTADEAG